MPDDVPSVFVSYARADRESALKIVSELEHRGFRCWIDVRDIKPGERWAREIWRAIDRSCALLLILSKRTSNRPYVKEEVNRAIHKRKSVIPYLIENVKPKGGLAIHVPEVQWVEAFKLGERAFDEVVLGLRHAEKMLPPRDIGTVSAPDRGSLRIVGKAEVIQWGWNLKTDILADQLLALDKKLIREAVGDKFGDDSTAGTTEQWREVFRERPENWRLLVDKNNVIVGYWEMHLLFDDVYQKMKAGVLDEDNVTLEMMPSDEFGHGTYPAYFSMIAFEEDCRVLGAFDLLKESFFEVILFRATQGTFISEIVTRGWTPLARALCRQMAMKCILEANVGPEIKVPHFWAPIKDVLLHAPARMREELQRLYKDVRTGDSAQGHGG